MADTIIGTAGAFFTLGIIAVAAFVVGLVIFAVVDFLKNTARHRRHGSRHGHHSGPGGAAAHAYSLATHVHRAATEAAASLLNGIPGCKARPGEDLATMVAAEFAFLLAHLVEEHLGDRLDSPNGLVLRHTLHDVIVGAVHRGLRRDVREAEPLHNLMSARLADYRRVPVGRFDLYSPPPALLNRCAEHIAARLDALDGDPRSRLPARVFELVQTAITLDLAPLLAE